MAIVKATDYTSLQQKIKNEIKKRAQLSFAFTDFTNKPVANQLIQNEHLQTIINNLKWVTLSDEDKEKYKIIYSTIQDGDIIHSLEKINELVKQLQDSDSYGCHNNCTGYCTDNCTDECSQGCQNYCNYSCSGVCGMSSCSGSCTGDCGSGSCSGECTGGCGSYCSNDACTSRCMLGCGHECSYSDSTNSTEW